MNMEFDEYVNMTLNTKLYILDEDRNVVEVDAETYFGWWRDVGNHQMRVGGSYAACPEHRQLYHISTVFLRIDHNISVDGPPLLFETMVFPMTDDAEVQYLDKYCARYTSWDAAKKGHENVVTQLMAGELELHD